MNEMSVILRTRCSLGVTFSGRLVPRRGMLIILLDKTKLTLSGKDHHCGGLPIGLNKINPPKSSKRTNLNVCLILKITNSALENRPVSATCLYGSYETKMLFTSCRELSQAMFTKEVKESKKAQKHVSTVDFH